MASGWVGTGDGFKFLSPPMQNKRDTRTDVSFILVGEAGLEPARPQ